MKQCLDDERDALLLFKAPLHDHHEHLSKWTAEGDDCCNWKGVTCSNQTGHVTGLDVIGYWLEGEISHSLLNLTYLNILDLSYNSFRGTIPTIIGSLTELRYLDLGWNHFNGTIPPEFGNLTNLQHLHLNSVGRCRVKSIEWLSHLSHLQSLRMGGISLAKQNHWVDVILSLQKLSDLSLGGCELSQVMYPYSSSFLNSSSSSSIVYLYLQNNNLTSSMYRWLLPLTSNKLRFLYLSSNMLDGIPKYLGNLCSLEYLEISNNSAAVKFPDFLNNLSGCTSLSLQELSAQGSQFTGSFSIEIQKFSSLMYLYLTDNHLIGSISEKLWGLPRLELLDISFNNLTVPSTYHLSNISYVKNLDLSSCKLLGPRFPKWIIQTLKNLTFLDLSNTGISDTIPLEFWDSWPSQLEYLNLSSNNISGKVPDLLSKFDKDYSAIDLSSNSFHGPILNVPSTLSILNLSRNKFSGGIAFICQIVDGFLEFLDLSHNSLTGQLPDCLWHFKYLRVLNLGHNNLFGRLPPSIGSLIQLQVLYVYDNNFSGELPLSLKNCTGLISLNLGANKFSGDVPVWIGENLSGLYVLILRSNNFFGTIPLQLCQLPNLQVLDLSMNNLHGSIPSCLSNLTSMLHQGGFPQDTQYFITLGGLNIIYKRGTYVDHAMIEWQGDEREFSRTLKLVKSIDLSSNNLTGQIPNEITNLSDLIALNFSKNALSGEIPQHIGEMKKLLTLDLSRNNLSGRMPSSMSQMSLLNYLDLSFNNLSGRIPTSTQLQSFEPSRYNGNKRLCGLPLTKKCPGDEEPEVPPLIGKGEGDGEDTDDDELWGWFCIGVGMGFATGFWIACGALLLNRQGRRAFFQFYDSFKDWVYVKVVVFVSSFQKSR
ncbi:receptor-like protein EIX2 isoform X2 [Lactuca sativa]|nr:receptor-like protein EIX2 isoform X2 [Lactuca sativa]XP_042751694.2 receptor-like protein EIX2 isoform X2 [Lactuca sativa]XP_042751695.2 receptor-like protein EIX2 isoform X2 [Lactuca sativa]XP_042751696.2 receptor-like protein EIX2 isoform X2 [Lactuca sativa]